MRIKDIPQDIRLWLPNISTVNASGVISFIVLHNLYNRIVYIITGSWLDYEQNGKAASEEACG